MREDHTDSLSEYNKENELEFLSTMIQDWYDSLSDDDIKEYKIGSDHHILYAGNINANIMVVKMCPDKAEDYWAKRESVHNGFVFTGPGGHLFRRRAKTAGFNPDEDFVYINIIPWYPIAGIKYPEETKIKLQWIYQMLYSIIKPDIIIPLGFDVYKNTVEPIGLEEYEDMCADQQMKYDYDDCVLYVPIEDADIVLTDSAKIKNSAFTKQLNDLFTIKERYNGRNQINP